MKANLKSLMAGLTMACASLLFVPHASMADALPTDKECSKVKNKSTEVSGWCAAVNRRQGNCLACHMIITPQWPEGFPEGGNAAPPLVAMKSRYPDKAALRAQVNDPREANPDSFMPPFGVHRLLTEKQIDDIVDFLYTL